MIYGALVIVAGGILGYYLDVRLGMKIPHWHWFIGLITGMLSTFVLK